jgi:hypothetical protein
MPETMGRRAPLYAALVHYPVLNRKGEVIASAVTNLDLHDMARTARTYGLPACYVVTPLKDQQVLAEHLADHWRRGIGKALHPDRAEALMRLRIVENIEAAEADIQREQGAKPVVWATTAKGVPDALAHEEARRRLLASDGPFLVLFGTGWGFAPAVADRADAFLEPIHGVDGYNHLSVRCAAAILMDRLHHARQCHL